MQSSSEPPPAFPRRVFNVPRACLWMFMGVSFYIFLALSFSLFNPESVRDTVSQSLLSSSAFLLVSISLLAQFPTGADLASSIGLRKTPWPLVLIGALVGVLLQFPAERIHQWMLTLIPLTEEQLEQSSLVFAHEGIFEAVSLFLALAVVVPLAEEVFFRGAVFVALRRAGRGLMVTGLTTGIGFALCHPQAQAFLPIALVALVLTLLRVKSASLYPSMAAHMTFNGATVLSQLLLSEDDRLMELPLSLELGLGATLLVSLVLFFLVAAKSTACSIAHLEETQPLSVERDH